MFVIQPQSLNLQSAPLYLLQLPLIRNAAGISPGEHAAQAHTAELHPALTSFCLSILVPTISKSQSTRKQSQRLLALIGPALASITAHSFKRGQQNISLTPSGAAEELGKPDGVSGTALVFAPSFPPRGASIQQRLRINCYSGMVQGMLNETADKRRLQIRGGTKGQPGGAFC